MSDGEFTYVGSELQLFAQARRWKAYLAQQVSPFLGRTVLEVGAGLGATTEILCTRAQSRWICLEPDPQLASRIVARRAAGTLPQCCEVVVGTLEQAPIEPIETILYIDVLEHIERDAAELTRAARRLTHGGHLVVLSPAHPCLFSEFDRAIGHHRRYTARRLAEIGPRDLRLERLRYLDSLGTISPALNRVLLRQALPTPRQIAFWDTILVPISRWLDVLVAYRVGRSVLAIWTVRTAGPG